VSWVPVPPDAPFGTAELPYGVFRVGDERPRIGVAVADRILDLAGLARAAGFDADVVEATSLNPFLALGPDAWAESRAILTSLLSEESAQDVVQPHLVPAATAVMSMPFEVADYVDFYASEHHARRVGEILRPGTPPLTPNWKHLPIGYHGRAGSVVVSGTEVTRPRGLRGGPGEEPLFGPTTKLDFEAELGWVVGAGSEGPVAVAAFESHVFGVVLLNDWSARDIQAYEYVPLGPFLGKSFATSISAWVVPLAALEEAATAPPVQDPPLAPYLQGPSVGYDLELSVELNGFRISRCPYASMYYTPAQLVAHTTVNGATLRTGDLLGSGTVSGQDPDQAGSLIELTRDARELLTVADQRRGYLEDGDEVVLRASAHGLRLGEVRGRICPSPAFSGS
jgi:fumarylacetoacetase